MYGVSRNTGYDSMAGQNVYANYYNVHGNSDRSHRKYKEQSSRSERERSRYYSRNDTQYSSKSSQYEKSRQERGNRYDPSSRESAFSRPSCKPSQTTSYQKVKLH